MLDEKLNIEKKCSEEVQDIIERIPGKAGLYVILLVLILTGIIFFFGFKIEYPEKVTGPITITARQSPVKLVSNSTGKMKLLKSNNTLVIQDEVIGYIENPANLEDVLKIEHYLMNVTPDSFFSSAVIPDSILFLSMGDLSPAYFAFLNSVDGVRQFQTGRPYEKRGESLNKLLISQISLQAHNQKQLKTKKTTLSLAQKSIKRDSILFKSSAIAEQDIERSSINYYNILQATQEMEKENSSLKIQMDDTKHKIEMLTLEKEESVQKLKRDLFSSYTGLQAAIRRWKLTFVLLSPLEGTLEYLNFWRENDFVTAGTEVFSILPADNPMIGQLLLPSQGAGKVSPGQDVIIKLDNYPYMEYGSISGKVKNISGVSSQTSSVGNQQLNAYLILVDLPEMLKTNYGVNLDFRYEIKGVAEILTKRRRLIERLFDNLKYIASKK